MNLLHIPVSLADWRTPRTTWPKLRKSWRESTRLSKSLEESCPTDSCSVTWDCCVFSLTSDLHPPLLMANERLNRWIARLMDWWCSVCLSCSWSLRGGGLMAPQLWQSSTLQIQELGVISNMTIIKEHPTQSIRKHAKMVGPNIFQIYFDFCIIHSSSALQTQVSLTLHLASCVS